METIIEDEMIPVFLLNGFLESGKTRFLKFTMQQEYFRTEGKTLLIVCEEGEEAYEPELLHTTKTAVVYVENVSELTPHRLEELELLYQPERILIEWNGIWNQEELCLPEDWIVYQQITIIDGSTFDLYLKNMKPFLAAMMKDSELIICNRCDEVEDLGNYSRTLRALNSKCQIIFEDSEGEIEQEVSEEDLPYDMKAEIIRIAPEAYGIWYIDCMDKPEHYVDKTIEFTAMVLKSPKFPSDCFLPGRMAMTCCAEDMTFLGYFCKFKEAGKLENKQWVSVRARVACEDRDGGDKKPVLYAETVKAANPIEEIVQF